MENSVGLFYCSFSTVTAVCPLASHLFTVFIYDARGFLYPFPASSAPTTTSTATRYVISYLVVLRSCVIGYVGILREETNTLKGHWHRTETE